MQFTKEHLVTTYYDWSKQTMHHVTTDEPDRRLFDPLNGNQILYLINFFGHSVGNLSIVDGQRVEYLIMNELPAELKSERAVFNWLRGKYLSYQN